MQEDYTPETRHGRYIAGLLDAMDTLMENEYRKSIWRTRCVEKQVMKSLYLLIIDRSDADIIDSCLAQFCFYFAKERSSRYSMIPINLGAGHVRHSTEITLGDSGREHCMP